MEVGSPHSDESPPNTATPPGHGTVRAHRFAAGRALALLQAARSGSSPSSPTHGKKSMSLDGVIPPEERSSLSSPQGWQGPLCPPSGASGRFPRRQRLGKMRHGSYDSESLSTRAGSPNHSPDEIEIRPWPSHEPEEKIRKPRSEVKLMLPIAVRGSTTSTFQSFPCPVASWTEANQAKEPTSWRAPGHVPVDCVIRRRKKRTKELRLALPFPVPKDDPRFRHLIETEGQPCQVLRSQSSFAWV